MLSRSLRNQPNRGPYSRLRPREGLFSTSLEVCALQRKIPCLCNQLADLPRLHSPLPSCEPGDVVIHDNDVLIDACVQSHGCDLPAAACQAWAQLHAACFQKVFHGMCVGLDIRLLNVQVHRPQPGEQSLEHTLSAMRAHSHIRLGPQLLLQSSLQSSVDCRPDQSFQ